MQDAISARETIGQQREPRPRLLADGFVAIVAPPRCVTPPPSRVQAAKTNGARSRTAIAHEVSHPTSLRQRTGLAFYNPGHLIASTMTDRLTAFELSHWNVRGVGSLLTCLVKTCLKRGSSNLCFVLSSTTT